MLSHQKHPRGNQLIREYMLPLDSNLQSWANKWRERPFSLPAVRVKIVKAECGNNAGLLGAARLGFVANRDLFR